MYSNNSNKKRGCDDAQTSGPARKKTDAYVRTNVRDDGEGSPKPTTTARLQVMSEASATTAASAAVALQYAPTGEITRMAPIMREVTKDDGYSDLVTVMSEPVARVGIDTEENLSVQAMAKKANPREAGSDVSPSVAVDASYNPPSTTAVASTLQVETGGGEEVAVRNVSVFPMRRGDGSGNSSMGYPNPSWRAVQDMYAPGMWPQELPWAIGGDLLASKTLKPDFELMEMDRESDEEDPAEGSAAAGQLAARRRIHARAMYLSRVAIALLALQRENFENKVAFPAAGVIVRRKVWLVSTFQAARESLPPWKKLIEEHRRFFHELYTREKSQEEVDGELVLMEPPMCAPIEGENVLWGPDRNFSPPERFGWDRFDESAEEVPRRVPRAFPTVPDPFPSESESDGERHLVRHAFGTAEATEAGVIDDEDMDRDE